MKTHDENWGLGKPFANINTVKTEHGEYARGEYHFKDGSVIIYSQEMESGGYMAGFTYYINGRGYYRTLRRAQPFSFRSLSILAGKFVKSLDK